MQAASTTHLSPQRHPQPHFARKTLGRGEHRRYRSYIPAAPIHLTSANSSKAQNGMSYIEPAEYLLHPNCESCLTSANV